MPYYFLYLYCDGDEQRLSECNANRYDATCYNTYLQCSDVRLEDGVAKYSGRVEIFYNGEWGTVCSDEFDENDAAVVCRQAGYGPPVHYWIDPSHRRHGRIWLDDLGCFGTESTLSNCESSNWGVTNCDHTQDIFIECLGFCYQNINTVGRYFTAEYESTPSYTDSTATFRCNEGYALMRAGSAVCASNGEWIIDYPDCRVSVRLIDESSNLRTIFTGGVQDVSRGRVEVLINRQWHTVCSRGFGFKDANVICNQLGLNGVRYVRTDYYGEGSGGTVALRNRGCDGGERNFLECDLSAALNCTHADDVGIECIDVRLVPLDNRSYSGRVEVFFNNEWGQVCSDLLRPQTLQVVCSQIGYPSTMSQPFSSDLPASSRVWIYDLDCTGTESTLLECPSDVEYHIGKVHGFCYRAAGVTCVLSGICRPFLPPENGYYLNEIQQTYYANSSMNSIQVACKDGYVLVDRYGNSTNDTAICQSNGYWNQQFYCFESVQFQYGFKASAGRVYVRGQNSLLPVCDRNWDLKDATVICHELGYPGAVRATRRSYFTYRNNPTPQSEMETLFSDIDCTGSENSIHDCPDVYGNPISLIPQLCSSQNIAGVICDENIRLTGGSTPYEGRVEVFLKGQWGTVCSTEEVTTAEAATLCNSLGFGPPRSVVSGALYGDTTDIPILVNNLVCQGAQDDLSQCRITINQLSSCTHDNDIGLVCSPAVRFVEDDVRFPWEGEIEVYYGRQWDRVCNADWDINDANVVCRELGFSGASSAEYARATPGGYAPVILDGALCVGTETHLLDCPRIVSLSNVTSNCLGNYAGVTCITAAGCEGLTPPDYGRIVSTTGNNIDDTTTFECNERFTLLGSTTRRCLRNGQWSGVPTQCAGLRLADGLNDLEGRVEIYYQGKWGTICDKGWDINDGAVVCRQLGYQEVLSVTTMASSFGPGSGPIQLQDVACQGNENNLFMCSLPSDLGEISTCLHNNDAGVICGGCKVLQSPNYGSISATLDSPEPGDTVTFTCNDGYNLLGSNSRTCLPTGLWSGEAVTCQATCKLEDVIKDEKVILDSDNEKETYVEDEQVTVKCDFGYEMAGGTNPTIVRVCRSDQTWSGIDPNCTRIEGFPDTDRTTSDDGNNINSSTGVATIVLAVILCLVIVIGVVGLAVFFIQKSRVKASERIGYHGNDDKEGLTIHDEADDSNK